MAGGTRRFGGRAGAAKEGVRVLAPFRAQQGAGATNPDRSVEPKGGVQLKAIRKDGWTPPRRKVFLETLQATANVSEAARVAGMNMSSAYYLRRHDAGFAREWEQALAVGYAELEALLLRQSLFGVETVEITQDGAGEIKSRKVKRGHPMTVAVRLLLAHRKSVQDIRGREMTERPDGPDAIERLRAALDLVRARQTALEDDGEPPSTARLRQALWTGFDFAQGERITLKARCSKGARAFWELAGRALRC